jgi:signal transduction histidine kinase
MVTPHEEARELWPPPGWAVWATAFAAALLLLLWTRSLATAFLVLAGVAVIGCVLLLRFGSPVGASGAKELYGAVGVLVLALVVGGYVEERFERVEFDWPELAAERQARLSAVLARHMTVVVERGRSATQRAVQAAAPSPDRWRLFGALDNVRAQTEVEALVVLTESGDLKAWAGDHRGSVPDEVRYGAAGTYFVERPLYSYLYFSSEVPGRGERAVAVVLVETGLVTRAEADEVPGRGPGTEIFAKRTAVDARFSAGAGRGEGVVWSLVEGTDTIAHARLEPLAQADLRAQVERGARLFGVIAALIVVGALAVGWLRAAGRRRPTIATAVPLAAAAVALVIAPLDAVVSLAPLFSPLVFVLPSPGDLTLGVVLAALVPVAALVATARPPQLTGRSYALALAAGTLAVALGYAGAIRLFLDAATPLLMKNSTAYWVGLQFAVVLLLTMLTGLALPRHRGHRTRHVGVLQQKNPGSLPTVGGLTVSALLAVLVLLVLEPGRELSTALATLWSIPFLLVAAGGAFTIRKAGRLLRWMTAGWLAATAVLPHFWAAHLNARLSAAGQELSTLGAESLPFLDFLLHKFARETAARELAGEEGLQLLYRSWVASGLARQPYGAHIILWSDRGVREEELGLGGAEGTSAAAARVWTIVREALTTGETQLAGVVGLPEVSKVMAAPLPSGRAVSVSVPPRRTLERRSAVAPFLGVPEDPEMRLTLVQPHGSEPPSAQIRWLQSANGFRSEALVHFPDGDYHAHLEVRVASVGMRVARGVLLLALDLTLLAALWWLGHAARGSPPLPVGGVRRLAGSYRARVTLALFLFYLIPTALFGWVAYGALAGEVERSARRIAERTVRQAVAEFPQPTNDIRELAARAGTDVLRYFDGELADVSSPETLELGVYGAWMPPDVYIGLESGEETGDVKPSRVGQESFLMAYHTVRPAGALAVPTALSAADAAVRQRELAHLILFAALVGGILSLVLSVAVGRALAGPIGRLQRAAGAVGAGQLNVRLPEPPGEFGQLFASFNRMTRRLRRARAQELRTARVLAWGEMARQIAHEIKNPLTPIKLAVQHLRRAYNDGRRDFGGILGENVDQILTEIDRLTEIARAFSRYGAPGEMTGPLAPVDVGAVVHEALTLYRAGDPNVQYGEEVDRDLPAAQARTGELKEVIINLLENARIALDGQGSVLVRAYQTDGRIELEVQDTGPGIPADLLPRIFEPQFSTRSTGTGLGLPIVRRIVESWGGSVTAESEHGRGTTVRVRMVPVG